MSETGREFLEGIGLAFLLVFGALAGFILVFWLGRVLLT